MAIAICVDPDCEKIFYGKEIADLNLFEPNVKLPCGHKAYQIIFGASMIRDAILVEEKFKTIKPRLDIISKEYCNHCCYDDGDCNKNPFGEKCERMKYE